MTVSYNQNGVLTLGNTNLKTLAQSFGTPTIVYDEMYIRQQMRRYHQAFQKMDVNYVLSYASKAFTCIQMVKLADEENFDLDVVSIGELYTAIEAGFDPKRIHFHGNNKTKDEIQYALKCGIGYFVVDALDEIALIDQYATESIDVLIRVNPGVEAHTHEFIQTGQEKSKFGLSIKHGLAQKGVEMVRNSEHLHLKGIHFHIGSQIEETTGMKETAKIVLKWLKTSNINIEMLNIGGGFAVKYVDGDSSFNIEEGIPEIVKNIKFTCHDLDYPLPTLSIEPGRSIVAEAGVSLYEVGSIKEIPNVNKYVSVDGGMSDHIRTALYDAKYDVKLVNRNEPSEDTVTIAGKLCESGDILIHEAKLPSSVQRGDYLAVLSTGAYHYSMASNYNQIQKPAVFFVSDGKAREVIKRQSLRQLIINDVK
ncbi:diaminopimelate decarboxylase [Staphylococcus agnetis]|uniref:diaminopimelate decarboxylase n=1 Tax=Staphylococcus agnetis TaxID=985762 RepID=UPI00208F9885|nr:diaminopimelate decarboxylase [Staphylococcus agnetis]MCO4345874.1 diaminopimelate decarboxylase [Staphylococcus agnetis]MCO4354694.1 diaminopimelate decarboxylase [Staphylococcus agnetis]MCO4359493.1 diaminopimelate decarboxylase [Staphylococcus agnetis]MCO4364785.1 diaminopimelate decarboxylase [Staphylococcus agnetis]MCO4371248.1 diaminopimelate decarboxylase [Staphylococcus agnetis]